MREKLRTLNITFLDQVVQLAIAAGDLILEVYQRDTDVETQYKIDQTPLTEADLASHRYLLKHLSQLYPAVPILSEEGQLPTYGIRSQWSRYWLIDPLDGTKEFINRNGEFTVNIALIDEGRPVLGVVYVPVTGVIYKALNKGGKGDTALRAHKEKPLKVEVLQSQSIQQRVEGKQAIRLVTSRHHGKEGLALLAERIRQRFGTVTELSIGSSLKICLVAAGEADLYPRFGPTSEWDTAAAQAIVEAAGGSVVDSQLQLLRYNQKDSILNPDFFVLGDANMESESIVADWLSLLS